MVMNMKLENSEMKPKNKYKRAWKILLSVYNKEEDKKQFVINI